MGCRIVPVDLGLLSALLRGGGMPVISNAPADLEAVGAQPGQQQGKLWLVCVSASWPDSGVYPPIFEPEFTTIPEKREVVEVPGLGEALNSGDGSYHP